MSSSTDWDSSGIYGFPVGVFSKFFNFCFSAGLNLSHSGVSDGQIATFLERETRNEPRRIFGKFHGADAASLPVSLARLFVIGLSLLFTSKGP
jgi:hypothetical protein